MAQAAEETLPSHVPPPSETKTPEPLRLPHLSERLLKEVEALLADLGDGVVVPVLVGGKLSTGKAS